MAGRARSAKRETNSVMVWSPIDGGGRYEDATANLILKDKDVPHARPLRNCIFVFISYTFSYEPPRA